jgi:uncharacterized tellurite resistance protein B-like protein
MDNANVIMPLAKVIVAAAWADGQVSNEELNSLKDLLFRMPKMEAREWSELDIYLETPVDQAERERLVADLSRVLTTQADRDLAVQALDEVLRADGKLSDEEAELLMEIKSELEPSSTGIFARLGRATHKSANRHAQSLADAPNRELYLDDYVKNPIYYLVKHGQVDHNLVAGIPENDLRRLSLAGGLMARVAFVDQRIDQQEQAAMIQTLQTHWNLSPDQAALVIQVADSQIAREMDYYRLARGFFESTSETERLGFLDVLFAIAASEGRVSNDELEEIRSIAIALKLTHSQFIDARLKVPANQR